MRLRRLPRSRSPFCRSRASDRLLGALVALVVTIGVSLGAQQTGSGVLPIMSPFTGGGAFTGQLLGPANCSSAPAFAITGDADTGSGGDGGNQWCVSVSGTQRLELTAIALASTVPIFAPSGNNTLGWSDAAFSRIGASIVGTVGVDFRVTGGGTFSAERTGVGTGTTAGMTVVTTTAATGGAPVQASPLVTWQGNAWDTAASQTLVWHVRNLPASAATPTSTLQWLHSLNGAAMTLPMSITDAGLLTLLDSVNVGAGSYFGFGTSRSITKSTSSGLFEILTRAEDLGIQFNTGTAAPTVGTCGTGTITDEAGIAGAARNGIGKVTATGATACTITFGAPAWTNAPTCVVSMRNIPITLIYISAVSTTAFTVNGLTANDVFSYKCEGRI